MSIRSRPEYQWPKAADQNSDTGSPSAYSSLSVRRQYEHAIPTGTVASRIRNLQNLQNAPASRQPSSDLSTRQPSSGRASVGRRLSSRVSAPVPRNLRPNGESQIEKSHSYFRPPRTRPSYKLNNATSFRQVPASPPKASNASTPASNVSPKSGNHSKTPKDREISAYKTALSDYSRQEIDRITEVDSHDQNGRSDDIAGKPEEEEDVRVVSEAPSYLSENTDVTTSTTRRESVRELFNSYGIERPQGLVSSTDNSPEELDQPQRKHAPPLNTPIADSFMGKKPSQDIDIFQQPSRPPTPPPLPPPRGSSAKSDHAKPDKHKASHNDQTSSREKKNSDQLIAAERLRHEKAKEELRNSRMGSIQKDGSSGSKVTQSSTPVNDHTNHSPDNLTRMIAREARLQKKGRTPESPKSSQRPTNDGQATVKGLKALPIQSPLVRPTPAIENYAADIDTPQTQPFHTPQQFPASAGYFAYEKQEVPTRSGQLQSSNSTNEHVPTYSSPLAQHRTERVKTRKDGDETNKSQMSASEEQDVIPKPLATPKRNKIRVQKPKATPISAVVREARKSQSEYVTSLEAQSPAPDDASWSSPHEEFSFIAGDPEIISGRTAMQSPIVIPTSGYAQTTGFDSYRRRERSHSSSVSIASPLSSCGTDTCRATHSGHAPYRHSISCTEKRRLVQVRRKTDSGYEGGPSHDSHHHAEPRQDHSSRESDRSHSRAEHHQDHSSRGSNRSHSRAEHHQAKSPEPRNQCRYCSGNLDRCRHCRDDCQCDNCQGLLHFTRQYVLAEQERRSNLRHHASDTLRASGDIHRNGSPHSRRPRPHPRIVSNSPIIISPIIRVEEKQHLTRHHAPHESHGEKYQERPDISHRDQHEGSSMLSEPHSFVSAAAPVFSPIPQRNSSWTQQPPSLGLDTTAYVQKPVTRAPGLPQSKSWRAQKQKSINKSRPASPRKHHDSAEEVEDIASPEKQYRSREEKARKPARPSPAVLPNSPDARLPLRLQERDRDRRPSIQKAPNISKILTQHHTAEIRAPTPPPWSPQAQEIRKKSRPKISGPGTDTATKQRSSSLATAVVLPPSSQRHASRPSLDSDPISPRTPRKAKADPFSSTATRSASEELVKQAPSICPPRIPIRRSQNVVKGERERYVLERPHTSLGHDDIRPSKTPSARSRTSGTAPTTPTPVSCPESPLVLSSKDEGQRGQKKVTKRLSTLFGKKSTATRSSSPSPPELDLDLEETSDDSPASRNAEDKEQASRKRSKGLKTVKNTGDDVQGQSQKRRWSLKLGSRKDGKGREHELRDCREDDEERDGGSPSENLQLHEDAQTEPGSVRRRPRDDDESLSLSQSQSQSQSQDWSRSGKGHISSLPPSAAEDDEDGREPKDATPDKSQQKQNNTPTPATAKLDPGKITKPLKRRPAVLRNRNQTGLVSSKVEKWNQELARIESPPLNPPPPPPSVPPPMLPDSVVGRDGEEVGLETETELELEMQQGHDCLWKSMYLAERDVLGVTVRVHLKGRQDVLVKGRVE